MLILNSSSSERTYTKWNDIENAAIASYFKQWLNGEGMPGIFLFLCHIIFLSINSNSFNDRYKDN